MSPIQRARAVSQAQITLGVETDASEQDIHAAWKKLAFRLHPDRGASDGGDALANVNAAYTLLKSRAKSFAAKANMASESRPANTDRVRPRTVRPTPPVKITRVDPVMQAACKTLVANEPAGTGHVATEIERAGRKVTYVVETPLVEGVNRVAAPVMDFAEGRQPKPTSIAFRSSKAGPGTLDLPQDIREKTFPGATSIKFRFAG